MKRHTKITAWVMALLILSAIALSASAQTTFSPEIQPITDSKFYLGSTTPTLRAWLQVIADSFYDTDATDGCASWLSGVLTSTGVACGSGGGSGGGTWSTTTSSVAGTLFNYPNNTSDVVLIGSNSSTTAEFWFDPNTAFAKLNGQLWVTGSTTLANFAFNNATGTRIYLGSGTNANAAISLNNDENTGIYSASTDFVTLLGGGTSLSWTGSHFRPHTDNQALLGTEALRWKGLSTVLATSTQATTTSLFATTASSTNLASTNFLFGGVLGNSWDDFCVSITGSSALCDGDDASGSGGAAAVATSTNETAGRLAYWTSTSGTPATLGEVATSSVTINAPLTTAGTPGFVVSGSGWTLDIDDIKAADLDLTDITLNDFTNDSNYLVNTRQLTIAGTANQIDSSAGAQNLTADRTWTLSLPNHVIFPSSFQVTRATTTHATTTNLDITSLLTFNGVTGSTWAAFCQTIRGGAGLCDGDDASGGASAATGTVAVFNAFTQPDTGGNAWFEPYTITATNDVFGHLIAVASSTTAKAGFYTSFHVPDDYSSNAAVEVYFSCPVATGDVVVDIDYRAVGGDDAESLDQATFQESVTATKACGSAVNERQKIYFQLTGSNFAAGDTAEMYVSRDGADGSDTAAAGMVIHDVVFVYQK